MGAGHLYGLIIGITLVEQSNGQWPEEWVLGFLTLLDLQTVTLEVQNNDCTMWMKKDRRLCKFSVSQAYSDLIHDEDDVEWLKKDGKLSFASLTLLRECLVELVLKATRYVQEDRMGILEVWIYLGWGNVVVRICEKEYPILFAMLLEIVLAVCFAVCFIQLFEGQA
ncbi:hypothetical protein Tco_1396660, partial [Tanacetum coccineum]